jgi:hypothetical protein
MRMNNRGSDFDQRTCIHIGKFHDEIPLHN